MKICLLAWGSRGDVQPMVALGRGLRAAGHEVTIAAGRDFTPTITAAGLVADPFDVDMHAEMQSPHGQRWLGGSSRREEGKRMHEVMERFAPRVADHLPGLVERHDAFLSGVITFGAMLPLARTLGKRHILASLTPVAATRSGAASMSAVRPDSHSALNLVAGWATAAVYFRILRPVTRAVCARTGLPRQTFRDYVRDGLRTPAVLGVSPRVVPPPRDAPANQVTTGYWIDALASDYAPPPDLATFLQSGPAPVYLGFGSMPSSRPEQVFDLMRAALRRAGRRGLVHGNWGGWRPDSLPGDVLVVDSVPHEWLFPRTAAVVHHGGAGTTAAAIRAGVPQFVAPHMGDQYYWGRRVAQLGLGPAPVPRHALDVGQLATALTRLTEDETMRVSARTLGDRVRAEDGVSTAVKAVGRLLTI